jgi:curli biogenesis system outer membrane secretion channel CsgG
MHMSVCKSSTVCVAAMACALVLTLPCGAAKSTETAEADKLTAGVGQYPPPPAGITPVRVGVPLMQIQSSTGQEKGLETLASDELNTLLFQTERFDVVERTQVDKLLAEQNMEGIVRPDQLAKAGQVLGADLLLIGKVTNLRIKAETSKKGFGVGNVRLPFGGSIGGFDYKKKESKITAECGVDLRLVDSTSGQVVAAHFGEFKRIDSIGTFGVEVLGASATADADLDISDDDKGKILRLALDEALRKMLPKIDKYLVSHSKEAPAPAAASATPPAASATPGAASATPGAAKHFCAQCGKEMGAGAKFCANCGAKAD